MWRPSRARWVLLAIAGCGRIGFGSEDDDGAPPDEPLPPMICADVRSPIAAAGGDLDLAVSTTRQGYIAGWAPVTGGPFTLALLDDLRRISLGPDEVAPGPFTGIAGLTDVGDALSIVTLGTDHIAWRVPHSLDDAIADRIEPAIASRPSIASSGAARALFRAVGNDIVMSYVTSDGAVGADSKYTAANPVTAIAVDDGPGHGHITWTEADAGASTCRSADVFYPLMAPMFGTVDTTFDCHEARTASGPDAMNSVITVLRTPARNLVAKHFGNSTSFMMTISLAGRAPRARFDGDAHFWIAWIEELPAPMLRIARLGLDGSIVRADLPNWKPAGDEAFELIRNGPFTYLAVLGSDALNMLTLCPP